MSRGCKIYQITSLGRPSIIHCVIRMVLLGWIQIGAESTSQVHEQVI